VSLLDALDPDYKMALRPLVAIDDQYIVQIAVAIRLVQYLLTAEFHPGGAPESSDNTGVVDLWQKLHNWALGCVIVTHTHAHTRARARTHTHTHTHTHAHMHTRTHLH